MNTFPIMLMLIIVVVFISNPVTTAKNHPLTEQQKTARGSALHGAVGAHQVTESIHDARPSAIDHGDEKSIAHSADKEEDGVEDKHQDKPLDILATMKRRLQKKKLDKKPAPLSNHNNSDANSRPHSRKKPTTHSTHQHLPTTTTPIYPKHVSTSNGKPKLIPTVHAGLVRPVTARSIVDKKTKPVLPILDSSSMQYEGSPYGPSTEADRHFEIRKHDNNKFVSSVPPQDNEDRPVNVESTADHFVNVVAHLLNATAKLLEATSQLMNSKVQFVTTTTHLLVATAQLAKSNAQLMNASTALIANSKAHIVDTAAQLMSATAQLANSKDQFVNSTIHLAIATQLANSAKKELVNTTEDQRAIVMDKLKQVEILLEKQRLKEKTESDSKIQLMNKTANLTNTTVLQGNQQPLLEISILNEQVKNLSGIIISNSIGDSSTVEQIKICIQEKEELKDNSNNVNDKMAKQALNISILKEQVEALTGILIGNGIGNSSTVEQIKICLKENQKFKAMKKNVGVDSKNQFVNTTAHLANATAHLNATAQHADSKSQFANTTGQLGSIIHLMNATTLPIALKSVNITGPHVNATVKPINFQVKVPGKQ